MIKYKLMTSKEDLIILVKEWLEIDDKLKKVQQEAKSYRDKKKTSYNKFIINYEK